MYRSLFGQPSNNDQVAGFGITRDNRGYCKLCFVMAGFATILFGALYLLMTCSAKIGGNEQPTQNMSKLIF